MEAPAGRMDWLGFDEAIKKHIRDNYYLVKEGSRTYYKCRKCGTDIQQTTCYVSIHNKLFSICADSGRVICQPLPYCPTCEGAPKNIRTCVHV
jgi:hypothetical protein